MDKQTRIEADMRSGLEQVVDDFARHSRINGEVHLHQLTRHFRQELRSGDEDSYPELTLGFCKPYATYEAASQNENSNAHEQWILRLDTDAILGPYFKNISTGADEGKKYYIASFQPRADENDPKVAFNVIKRGYKVALIEVESVDGNAHIQDAPLRSSVWPLQMLGVRAGHIEEPKRLFKKLPIFPLQSVENKLRQTTDFIRSSGKTALNAFLFNSQK